MADVIERMTDKFMTVLHEKRPDMSELESAVDAVRRPQEAMLAAVRELHAISVSPGPDQGTLMTQNWLSDRINDHERRSEVKRGDS